MQALKTFYVFPLGVFSVLNFNLSNLKARVMETRLLVTVFKTTREKYWFKTVLLLMTCTACLKALQHFL